MRFPNLFLASFLIQLLLTMNGFSQIHWTYNSINPVIAMDTAYMWEAIGQPACIIHNDTIKMWYAVAGGENPSDYNPVGRIHYAWSDDGVTWTKYPGNPVLDVGAPGEWDDAWLDTPEILWDGTEFKLYYYGDSTYFQGQDNTNIGLATSADGIHWTKQGVVLSKGAPCEWDGKYIESPAAYYDPQSGVHALWYNGQDTTGWIKIGLAVSADGYDWYKWPGNPVVGTGDWLQSWDDMFVAVPAVIRSGDIFEMWYSGISFYGQFDSVRIGYAVSVNGIDWIKYPGNPVLEALSGDSAGFWAVDVVFDSINN
ncbi:MAG: hypothetical protein KJ607_11640 [Bacteroidetes bacterium]|nr:hypothetical protein [Bacteroidota bacterium]